MPLDVSHEVRELVRGTPRHEWLTAAFSKLNIDEIEKNAGLYTEEGKQGGNHQIFLSTMGV
jgi:hypothetical protein